MDLHLPLVVATPTLLCLLAALAALLWPRRSVLWPFLLPAWGLDLCFLGLLQSRAELAGPVLVWFRIDLLGLVWTALAGPVVAVVLWRQRAAPAVVALRERPFRLALLHALVVAFGLVPVPLLLAAVPLLGLVWTALAGPVVAVVLWRQRSSPAVVALRERPWRLALLHALVVAFGLVPVPLLLAAVPLLGLGPFRWRFAPVLFAAALLAAVVGWPFPGIADAVGALGAVVFAAACTPRTVGRGPGTSLALAWAALGLGRAILAG